MTVLGCSLDGCNHLCCFSCLDVSTCRTHCDCYDSHDYGENCEYVFTLVKEDSDVGD